jgi:hypothetical protein
MEEREAIGPDADEAEKTQPGDRAYSVGKEPAPTGATYEEKVTSAEGAESDAELEQ